MPLISPEYLQDIERELQEIQTTVSAQWVSSAATNIGRVRPSNEDAFYCSDTQGLWLVADGMGGLNRGDRASSAVVDAVRSFQRRDSLSENVKDLETRFLLANTSCRNMFRRSVIGSTLAAMLAFEGFVFFIWAGDSRVYRLRDGHLQQVTADHNLVQEKIARAELTPEEAERHPSANVLTRAIGVHENLRLEIAHSLYAPGDRYLICSDGLYRDPSEKSIAQILEEPSPKLAVLGLIDKALEQGGSDNITAIVIDATS